MEKEYILSAAIHYNNDIKYLDQPIGITKGLVFSGYRHDDIRYLIEQSFGNDYNKLYAPKSNDGFLMSHNRFVNRKEGFTIAKENNQLEGTGIRNNGELTSEDLY